MEINNRIQDKFSSHKNSLWIVFPDGTKRESNFSEIELILKDIRFIRHELATYSYLYASQLSFDGHLNKKYWEFLNISGELDKNDRNELEEGILLITYLMYAEIYELENWAFIEKNNLFETIKDQLKIFKPDSEKKNKMVEITHMLIENCKIEPNSEHLNGEIGKKQKEIFSQILENSNWVHKNFVEEYFIEIANSFKLGRNKTEKFNKWIENGGEK